MKKYPTSRAEARLTGAKFYYTGEPCKRGHIALRKTKGACVECAKEDSQKAYETRTEYFKAYNRRSEVKERRHEWYIDHRQEVIDRASSRPAEVKRQYRKAWKAANPDKVRAHTKNRRRKHRNATPPWLTARQKNEMRQIYRAAHTATRITGIKYVVDHICPLQGETSCGLHVPWNLRIITESANAAKRNTVPEGAGLAFPDGSGYTRRSEGAA